MNSSKMLLSLVLAAAPLNAGDKATGTHQSTTVIQIHETVSPLEFDIVPSKNFFRNQVATLTTGSVLDRAASDSKIDADKIKKSLSIKIIEGTDLVRITSTSSKADEPKKILNALTEAYVSVRSEGEQKKIAPLLKTMEIEVQRQQDRVQDHRKELTVLIQQYGIPVFDKKPSPSRQSEEVRYHEKLDQLAQSRDQLKIQIRKLIETSNKDLIRTAAGLKFPDNRVTGYYTDYRNAEERVSVLFASGLGKKHPEIVAPRNRRNQTSCKTSPR